MSKKTIENEEWNAWTADVRTFVADKKEVLRLTQIKLGEDFDKEDFDNDFSDIVKFLSRGDKRMAKRASYKTDILDRGRDMAKWPKRQGGGLQMPVHQVAVLNQANAIYNEAYSAFWNVLESHDAQHLEMTRSSKKDGGTDGQPFGNLENFTKSRTASRIASFKGDIREGLWANADNVETFNLSQPISRPYVAKVATVATPDTEGEEE